MSDKKLKAKFYKYLLANRVNDDILTAIDTDTGRKVILSISQDGELYDKLGMHLPKPKQKRFWKAMYDYARADRMSIVPKQHLKEIQ